VPAIMGLVGSAVAIFVFGVSWWKSIGTVIVILGSHAMGKSLVHLRLRGLSIKRIVAANSDADAVASLPIDVRLANLKSEFAFVGVSAKVLWDSIIMKMMTDKRYERCRFRFLLLDPGGAAIHRRAEMEGLSGTSIRHDVISFVESIKTIKADTPRMDIEVRYYDMLPSVWIMRCDNLVYVQPFPVSAIGRKSPLMILDANYDDGAGFFSAYAGMIEELWSAQSRSVDS